MTNESENALPIDDKFWEHARHQPFKIVIKLDDDSGINVLGALYDIYRMIDKDKDLAKFLVTSMAAVMLASKDGKAKEIMDEVLIQAAAHDMDKELEKLFREERG